MAQSSNRSAGPPPPPRPAVEYNPNWGTFSKIPGFSIKMPGEPKALSQQIDTQIGQLTQYAYLFSTETGNYIVSYFDLPRPLTSPDEIKRALDSGRENMLAANKSLKLLKEQEIKVAGHDGQELLIEDGEFLVRQRAFIAGSRVFQILLAVHHKVAFKSGRPSADSNDFTDFYQMIVSKFMDSARTYNYGSGSAFKLDEELKKAVRGGVLNAKAISLPKPSYPDDILGATGTVTVQVLVDEEGKVIWAKALLGHPSLQEAARQAALKARFEPLKLQGQPAKVTGVLTYNFIRR
ncbi:MAG TPA: energy transducer TonB [Pyrinomonadaceae bacterium]|nr:energy transducer TonB [Pyrinomonadaceae bacterium]